MALFQRAYDELKEFYCRIIDGSIGDYIFVGMVVDPYPEDDELHEEDEDYIEFHFHNKVHDCLATVIVPCTKAHAARINHLTNSPCKESTWESLGICDDGYSKVNFDYYIQIGALGGYTEGE